MLTLGSLMTVKVPTSGYLVCCDRCLFEYTCCLRKDTAVQAGTSLKCNGSLDQKDSLHVCTSPHVDLSCDLPEDIICLSPPSQSNFLVIVYL